MSKSGKSGGQRAPGHRGTFPKPAVSGPAECPPAGVDPTPQRYNMASTGLPRPGAKLPSPWK